MRFLQGPLNGFICLGLTIASVFAGTASREVPVKIVDSEDLDYHVLTVSGLTAGSDGVR